MFTFAKVKNVTGIVDKFIDNSRYLRMQSYTVISHIFNGWDDIHMRGSIDDIFDVPRSSLKVFERFDTIEERNKQQTTFVAYIVEKNKVIAFGCATHFLTDENYYEDEDDECDCVKCRVQYGRYPPCEDGAIVWCRMESQSTRRLWIEGMASMKKGCGTLVLQELEKWLFERAKIYKLDCPINLMAVNESIGFYDKNGYIDCYTSPYWGGRDCTRMVKFENETARIAQTPSSDVLVCQHYELERLRHDDQAFCEFLAQLIGQDRIIFVNRYMNLPVNRDLAEYILDHRSDDIFGDTFTKERKEILIELLEDLYGYYIANKKAKRLAKKIWQEKYEVDVVTNEQNKFFTAKIKGFIDTIEKANVHEEKIDGFVNMINYIAKEGYVVCANKKLKKHIKIKCKSACGYKRFRENIKPETRDFVFALTSNINYMPRNV